MPEKSVQVRGWTYCRRRKGKTIAEEEKAMGEQVGPQSPQQIQLGLIYVETCFMLFVSIIQISSPDPTQEESLPPRSYRLGNEPSAYSLNRSFHIVAQKMATNFSSEQACLFPTLSAHSNERRGMRHKEINLPPRAALIKFCENHGVQPLSLYQTGWAVVLQAYTSSDSPVFGCQWFRDSGDEHSWTCCMALLSGESLLNMMKTHSLPSAAIENVSEESFNTAVVHTQAETGSYVGNPAMSTLFANHLKGPIDP